MMVDKKAESSSLWVFALMAAHLIISVPLAWTLNIWADEASTLYTTETGISHALQNALADEKQAPLYFWILSLWRELSHSIFFARFFSILCSLLAIKFFFDLVRRYFHGNAVVFVTAVFAIHPFLIWASLEIRVYSMIVLLSVLLLRLFEEGFCRDFESKPVENAPLLTRGLQTLFLIFAVIGLYTSYYIGFLLVGCFVALLITHRWQAAKTYLLLMIVAGLAFIPLLRAVYAQFSSDSASYHGDHSLVEGLQLIWNFFLTFALPTEIFTENEASRVSLVRLWIVRLTVVIIAAVLIKTRRILDRDLLTYVAISAVICAFLFASYWFLGSTYLQVRHSAVLFAPVFLVISLAVIKAIARVRSVASPLLALLLLASFTYSVVTLYPQWVKRGDWQRVAAHIQANEKAGQPIVVFTVFDVLALPYYYKGQNKILPDEKYFTWEPEASHGSEESLKKETDFLISEIPPEANEVWLVVNEKCLATKACVPLEKFVESNYTIIEEKDFYLEKVFLLRRR